MCDWGSTLTQKRWLARNIEVCPERSFMPTSSVGGSSETLHMAVAVKPPRPAGPSVVTMLTGAQTRAIASRNSSLATCDVITVSVAGLLQLARAPSGGSRVSPVQPFST